MAMPKSMLTEKQKAGAVASLMILLLLAFSIVSFAQDKTEKAKAPDYPFTDEQVGQLRAMNGEIAQRESARNEARAILTAREAELREASQRKLTILFSYAAKIKRDPADLEIADGEAGFNEKPKAKPDPAKKN
jgi:hypothetical protein